MTTCKRRGLKTPCPNPVVKGRKLCAYHLELKKGVGVPSYLVTRAGGVPRVGEER